ncbi:MAG: hypothetical protein ACRD1X_17895 [Vicinamibacteria bacterium]
MGRRATYAPIPERTFLSDVDEPRRRGARRACASTRAKYAWLDVDVCLTRVPGQKPALPTIQSGLAASRFFHEVYPVGNLTQELFFVLCLNAKLLEIPRRRRRTRC